jgi:hypothetical protein
LLSINILKRGKLKKLAIEIVHKKKQITLVGAAIIYGSSRWFFKINALPAPLLCACWDIYFRLHWF